MLVLVFGLFDVLRGSWFLEDDGDLSIHGSTRLARLRSGVVGSSRLGDLRRVLVYARSKNKEERKYLGCGNGFVV